jgi:DNA-binding LacI/PurR family transcriptional regulator
MDPAMGMFIANARQPVHVQLADRIKQMIAADYGPGETLPTYRELTRRFRAGMITVKRAMDILAAQGIVNPVPSRGTVVLRQLQAGESRLSQIGLVTSTSIAALFHHRYLSEICGSLCARVDRIQGQLRLFSLERHHRMTQPKDILSSGCDGVLLLQGKDAGYVTEFAKESVPLVVVDNYNLQVPLDYVVCDSPAAARTIVEHLSELGHRKLAYFGSHVAIEGGAADILRINNSDAVERFETTRDACRELDMELEPNVYFSSRWPLVPRANPKHLTAVLRNDPDAFSAVVADSDGTARGLLAAFAAAGFRVPEDVSVAAVAGSDLGNPVAAPLTYCRMNFPQMGLVALETLERRGRSPRPDEPNIIRVGYEFVRGATTGPPRRS